MWLSGFFFFSFFFKRLDHLLSALSHHLICVDDPVSQVTFAAVSAGYLLLV